MNLYSMLIMFSLILMGSFFYSYLLDKWFIAPVLLLIGTGVVLKVVGLQTHSQVLLPSSLLGLLGTIGLIVIVLEAAFDLKIEKENRSLFFSAMLSAALIIIFSTIVIGVTLQLIYHFSLHTALIYAVPLSIVSSPIVIPSVQRLTGTMQHEFIVLESIFADIMGIIMFDFILNYTTPLHSGLMFFGSVSIMVIISFLISIPLLLIISHTERTNKYVFVLAVLVFVYAVSKSFHLSALILVLIFGMTLNNIEGILKFLKIKQIFDFVAFKLELDKLRELTGEASFIIRTLFFVVFGYSIDLHLLVSWHVLFFGLILLAMIYVVRYLLLTLCLRRNVVLETFIAPRGLITILLYSQIPMAVASDNFKSGIIFFIIITTSIIMSANLIINGKKLLKTE